MFAALSAQFVPNRVRSRLEWLNDVKQRASIQRSYRQNPPPIAHGANDVLVVEALWDNPNHWLRLWMFMHAYLAGRNVDVVGVLWSDDNWDDWRKRKSLEALGVRRFLYLKRAEADDEAYSAMARPVLNGAKTLRDMLDIHLPDDLPAYTVFDTVLKQARHPQPSIEGNELWERTVAETLRLQAVYRAFFDREKVVGVVSSHAWKSEWATLCWTALRRNIPVHYLTAHYDSIRIRRMRSERDYRAPNENLTFSEFQKLPSDMQEKIVARGEAYMRERFDGNSDFIVMRYSIKPEQRGRDRASLLTDLGLDTEKPLVIIYAHSWFDFPHTQGMVNFTEPLDWLKFTVEQIKAISDVNWAIKPHPCDRWYANVHLKDMLPDLPAHIAVIPEESDSLAYQSIADAVVTIQGSIAIEAAAFGKTVVCADSGTYSGWGFTHVAKSRGHYAELLRGVLNLPKPTLEQSRRALAYAATALAPPPQGTEFLRLTCDTRFLEGVLYPEVQRILENNGPALAREIGAIREWLASPFDSYNAWRTLNYFGRREGVEP